MNIIEGQQMALESNGYHKMSNQTTCLRSHPLVDIKKRDKFIFNICKCIVTFNLIVSKELVGAGPPSQYHNENLTTQSVAQWGLHQQIIFIPFPTAYLPRTTLKQVLASYKNCLKEFDWLLFYQINFPILHFTPLSINKNFTPLS